MTPPGNLNLEGYDKIVTHNDFDGIVSASLCAWVLKIQKVTFAGPPDHYPFSNHDYRERGGL